MVIGNQRILYEKKKLCAEWNNLMCNGLHSADSLRQKLIKICYF